MSHKHKKIKGYVGKTKEDYSDYIFIELPPFRKDSMKIIKCPDDCDTTVINIGTGKIGFRKSEEDKDESNNNG